MAVISFSTANVSQVDHRRINGCSLPLFYLQIIGIIIIIFLILMSYLTLCVNIATHPWQWLSIVITSLLVLPFLITFVVISIVDPAETNVIEQSRGPRADFNRQNHRNVITDLYCNVCDVYVSSKAKHCSACNKCIYEFDHHCIWLNTCIGGRNYRLFLTMVTSLVLGTLFIFLNSLIQFIGSFQDSNSAISLKPYYPPDRYAILMIPSSLIAFQVVIAIVGILSLVAFGLAGYLLAFHVYLRCHGISTYDFVVNRRHNRTVDQTLSQFNQIAGNQQNEPKNPPRMIFQKRKKNNRVETLNNDRAANHTTDAQNGSVFTVENHHRDSPRRLQTCQSPHDNYLLNSDE